MPLRELEVCRVWADVLGIEEADPDTNFFDLGGNSMLLLELISELNEKLGIDTDVLTLLEYPSVAKFTSHLNSLEA